MPWRTLSFINIGFIGHVARYASSSTYLFLNEILRDTAPIHINQFKIPTYANSRLSSLRMNSKSG